MATITAQDLLSDLNSQSNCTSAEINKNCSHFHSLYEFYKTSSINFKDVLVLSECFIKHIDLLLNYLVDHCELRHIKMVENAISIMECIVGLENCRDKFVQFLILPILEKTIEPGNEIIFGKILLKFLNNILQGSNIRVRNKIVNDNIMYCCKLSDILCTCGDYSYQTIILETLFRLCSKEYIKKYAKDFFPEATSLQEELIEINQNSFDKDVRSFLNIVNKINKNVYSIKAQYIIIDDKKLLPPKDFNTDETLWIDFNKKSKSISIYFDKNTATILSEEFISEEEWDLITIENKNILKFHYKREQKSKRGAVNTYYILQFWLKGEIDSTFNDFENAKMLTIYLDSKKIAQTLINEILPLIFEIHASCNELESLSSQDTDHKENLAKNLLYAPLDISIATRTKPSLSITSDKNSIMPLLFVTSPPSHIPDERYGTTSKPILEQISVTTNKFNEIYPKKDKMGTNENEILTHHSVKILENIRIKERNFENISCVSKTIKSIEMFNENSESLILDLDNKTSTTRKKDTKENSYVISISSDDEVDKEKVFPDNLNFAIHIPQQLSTNFDKTDTYEGNDKKNEESVLEKVFDDLSIEEIFFNKSNDKESDEKNEEKVLEEVIDDLSIEEIFSNESNDKESDKKNKEKNLDDVIDELSIDEIFSNKSNGKESDKKNEEKVLEEVIDDVSIEEIFSNKSIDSVHIKLEECDKPNNEIFTCETIVIETAFHDSNVSNTQNTLSKISTARKMVEEPQLYNVSANAFTETGDDKLNSKSSNENDSMPFGEVPCTISSPIFVNKQLKVHITRISDEELTRIKNSTGCLAEIKEKNQDYFNDEIQSEFKHETYEMRKSGRKCSKTADVFESKPKKQSILKKKIEGNKKLSGEITMKSTEVKNTIENVSNDTIDSDTNLMEIKTIIDRSKRKKTQKLSEEILNETPSDPNSNNTSIEPISTAVSNKSDDSETNLIVDKAVKSGSKSKKNKNDDSETSLMVSETVTRGSKREKAQKISEEILNKSPNDANSNNSSIELISKTVFNESGDTETSLTGIKTVKGGNKRKKTQKISEEILNEPHNNTNSNNSSIEPISTTVFNKSADSGTSLMGIKTVKGRSKRNNTQKISEEILNESPNNTNSNNSSTEPISTTVFNKSDGSETNLIGIKRKKIQKRKKEILNEPPNDAESNNSPVESISTAVFNKSDDSKVNLIEIETVKRGTKHKKISEGILNESPNNTNSNNSSIEPISTAVSNKCDDSKVNMIEIDTVKGGSKHKKTQISEEILNESPNNTNSNNSSKEPISKTVFNESGDTETSLMGIKTVEGGNKRKKTQKISEKILNESPNNTNSNNSSKEPILTIVSNKSNDSKVNLIEIETVKGGSKHKKTRKISEEILNESPNNTNSNNSSIEPISTTVFNKSDDSGTNLMGIETVKGGSKHKKTQKISEEILNESPNNTNSNNSSTEPISTIVSNKSNDSKANLIDTVKSRSNYKKIQNISENIVNESPKNANSNNSSIKPISKTIFNKSDDSEINLIEIKSVKGESKRKRTQKISEGILTESNNANFNNSSIEPISTAVFNKSDDSGTNLIGIKAVKGGSKLKKTQKISEGILNESSKDANTNNSSIEPILNAVFNKRGDSNTNLMAIKTKEDGSKRKKTQKVSEEILNETHKDAKSNNTSIETISNVVFNKSDDSETNLLTIKTVKCKIDDKLKNTSEDIYIEPIIKVLNCNSNSNSKQISKVIDDSVSNLITNTGEILENSEFINAEKFEADSNFNKHQKENNPHLTGIIKTSESWKLDHLLKYLQSAIKDKCDTNKIGNKNDKKLETRVNSKDNSTVIIPTADSAVITTPFQEQFSETNNKYDAFLVGFPELIKKFNTSPIDEKSKTIKINKLATNETKSIANTKENNKKIKILQDVVLPQMADTNYDKLSNPLQKAVKRKLYDPNDLSHLKEVGNDRKSSSECDNVTATTWKRTKTNETTYKNLKPNNSLGKHKQNYLNIFGCNKRHRNAKVSTAKKEKRSESNKINNFFENNFLNKYNKYKHGETSKKQIINQCKVCNFEYRLEKMQNNEDFTGINEGTNIKNTNEDPEIFRKLVKVWEEELINIDENVHMRLQHLLKHVQSHKI